jgi:ribosomal protein S18 acetylase RimI-like enzyme
MGRPPLTGLPAEKRLRKPMNAVTPEPILRRSEPRDQDAVRELFIRINRELASPGLRDQFESYIALSLREEIDRIAEYYVPSPGRGFWVAMRGQTLLGMFGLEPSGDDAVELRRMYVDPAVGRSGVARRMLAHAERVAREEGFAKIVLSTSELQSAALGLYRAAGCRLVREENAAEATNKTVGGGIRRFCFEKQLETA